MSKLTKEQIINLGDRARIAITSDDAKTYLTYFERVTNMADKLQEVSTEDVQPTTHGIDLKNILRDDTPHEGLTEEVVFKNAPVEGEAGQFRVPTIIE